MKKFFLIMCYVFFVFMIGCASTNQFPAISDQQSSKCSNEAPSISIKTLAILFFENNSVTDPSKYEPLTKGLAAMLTTELQKNNTGLKLIEREQIQAVLKEIALSQSGAIDSSTAVQAGKLLGAQSIAFGSFMVLGEEVRIDIRIIKVETSEVILADHVTGNSNAFFKLVVSLSQQIATALNITLHPQEIQSQSKIEAALLFSKGLQALDNGDQSLAKRLFDECIQLDSSFIDQVKQIKGLQP